ncbi:MAG: hypothetical protein CL609_19015 [Anaerolineaceae bacterium]|nr:hypothetical protein [Anaerolineaceae bacterium]
MNRTWGTVVLGLLITLLIIFFAILGLYFLPDNSKTSLNPTAIVTVIEAPIATSIPRETWVPSPTPELTTEPITTGGLKMGEYAQIYGTDGDGLRIRTGPGQSYNVNFIGLDSEVFLIIGGPEEADGYVWWHLEAPYDEGRNGWAAENYLRIVTTP